MGFFKSVADFTRIACEIARTQGVRVMCKEIHRNYVKRYLPSKTRFMPTSVEFEVTTHCNLNCYMCRKVVTYSDIFKAQHMSLDLFEQLLERLPFLDLISFCGAGEPIMNPQIVQIASSAVRHGKRVSLFTNGMAMDEKMARALLQAKLDEIIFSIDSARQETYEQIRKGGDLDRVLKNLKTMGELIRKEQFKTRLSVMSLVMRSNYRELPELYERIKETGAVSWAAKQFNTAFSSDLHDQVLAPEEDQEFRQTFNALSSPALETVYANDVYLNEVHRVPCTKAWESPFVSVVGDLSICPHAYYRSGVNYGNLLEKDFQKIWNGEVIKKNRLKLKQGEILTICDECPVTNLWKSQCNCSHR